MKKIILQRNKLIGEFLYLFVIIVGIISFGGLCQSVHGDENQTPNYKKVKVGYFELGDYFHRDKSGNLTGYDIQYLNRIYKYSNLKFEYVNCKTWNNALKMLTNHKIDLLGTAQQTKEREKKYEFSEQYGSTYSVMFALKKSRYIFEDPQALKNATIGCVKNYVRISEFKDYIKRNKLTPKIVYYDNQQDLEKALETKKIDAAISSIHGIKSEYKVISCFQYSPYFFITRKGNNKLISTINEALVKINMNEPEFENSMKNIYLPYLTKMPFTKAELNYIAQKKTIKVSYIKNTAPLSWVDNEGNIKGILIDVCNKIEKNTGLKIEFVEEHSKEANSDDTVIFSIVNEGELIDNYSTANYFMKNSFVLYHLKSQKYDTDNKYKIAVSNNRENLDINLRKKKIGYEIVKYNNVEECFNALVHRKVDLVAANYYVGENDINVNRLTDIEKVPSSEMYFDYHLQVKDKMLLSILNKSISLLDKDEIKELQLKYALKIKPKYTLSYILNNYTRTVIAIIFIVAGILIVIGVLVTRMLMMTNTQKKLKEINQELEQATSAKNEFLSRMSHDMRTPMNGIIGMAALTLDIPSLPKEAKDNVGEIKNSGHYLLNLINDTLDMNKIESKKIELNYNVVDFRQLVETIVRVVRQSAMEKHINIRIENVNMEHRYVRIDNVRMQQIFTNLLSNAIKFTPEGGEIVWRIEILNRNDNKSRCKISVKDTGVGISKEFIDNVFEPFSQENNSESDKYAGTGLGLSIVKNLVDIMGGKIDVYSKLGAGTEFVVYLDLELVSDYKQTLPVSQARPEILKGKRVLLCEDHPVNAKITVKILEKAEVIVEWAENGQKGVEMYKNSKENYFDIILMDVRMPIMDGIEATKIIRKMDRDDAETIPIIALTANAYTEDRKKTIEAGMNEHLPKPIDPRVLYSTIEKLCK